MNEQVKAALNGLKDFQLKTVDYVFDRMYKREQNKMLIADEVGLGKTIIAKGIIARAFQKHLDDKKNRQFHVVYICSNQALSTQNIKKLNFTGDDAVLNTEINRLTYLAKKQKRRAGSNFRISSLTPGTSFDNKNKFGEAEERAILFALIAHYGPFKRRRNGLKWLLRGNKKSSWDELIKEAYAKRTKILRADVFNLFRKKLNSYILSRDKEPRLFEYFQNKTYVSLWHGLMQICDDLSGRNAHKFDHASELVSTLRRLLAQVCVRYLDADVFILDEFQRYNQLIKWEQEEQPPAVEMAKAVFSLEGAKIIMLSATPFKAYTNEFDELNGEVHYSEFKSVLSFLLDGKDELFWKDYEENRKAFHRIIADCESWKTNYQEIVRLKRQLETTYSSAIVRTERQLVANDGNALIEDVLKGTNLSIRSEDIMDFVHLDTVCTRLNAASTNKLPLPVEYVKSTPYALSFLDGYQIKKRLSSAIEQDGELKMLIRKNKDLFISKNAVDNYQEIISSRSTKVPNAKVRKLMEIDNDGWKLLWVPPTLPYYPSQGAFKTTKHFSKTLVFSTWVMVPKMIATLLSYEAERKTIGSLLASRKIAKDERVNYSEKPRSPKQQLTFKTIKGEEPRQLSNFTLIYPCITLANLFSPRENIAAKRTLPELRRILSKKIGALLDELNIMQFATGSGEMDKWFWAAPVLLDKLSAQGKSAISGWFAMANSDDDIAIDTEGADRDRSEHQGRDVHLRAIKNFFAEDTPSLPPLTKEKYDELIMHLVDITIASPATCLYRTYNRYFNDPVPVTKSAYTTALSFLSLFNKPESIAIIRLTMDENPYWKQVLAYCQDGNLQAMIDEFVYLLYDCENLRELGKLRDYITDILTLKTSTIDIDYRSSFLNQTKKLSVRTHYAMDFGLQKTVVTHGSNRQVNLRQTFNSPFRPFVLATTSIGQEGLDFHLYCKRIVHWNLPSNPIDFEQREGRINRYKSLVIRQNIAETYVKDVQAESKELLWDDLFELAKAEKKNGKIGCDLIPFWHVEPPNGCSSKIERYVPLYPYSKDIGKYANIQHVLTYYRLTFGQPRQDDLIKTFKKALQKSDFDHLTINLCPLSFKDSPEGV